MPAVAQEIAEPADGALIAHRFGRLGNASHAETRVPRILTAPLRVEFRHLQMEPQLLFRPGVVAMAEGSP
jgi:hypothetical protein